MKSHIIVMTAVADKIPETAENIAELGANAGLDDQSCFMIKVVIAEVLNNLVEHALPTDGRETIEIHCQSTKHNFIMITRDQGQAIDFIPENKLPSPESEGGRGWPIILSWMDSVQYQSEHDYNQLILKKRLP